MKDGAKRYRRKPAEYTEVERTYDAKGEPVVRLNAGDFDAIEVPWDEFKRDFEAVEEDAVKAKTERCRVGEWLPGQYMQAASGEFVLVVADIGAAGRNLSAYVISKNVGMLYPTVIVDRHSWDAARARWIADGRPSS